MRPRRARRQRELDPQRLGRRLAPGDRVGVGERTRREPRDVREAIGVDAARRPSAARTSRPCAHVSISRAVTNDGGRMPMPHGTRTLGSSAQEHLVLGAPASTPTTSSTSATATAPAVQHALVA